ncbi:hypothetical protein B0H16DRAFT_1460997 [Mycena metata]|uniref:MYND-type domain-containing protein n=1 Tax=Mycena metata TaxID=1033252 RepID=A0AAD7IT32_9AGAR|nr:hypothetical protein B0H16DRAFT_1460997 [Mycena metata]
MVKMDPPTPTDFLALTNLSCHNCHKIKVEESPSGKSSGGRCSGCRRLWYCSAECQKGNWPQHKVICNVIRSAENDKIATNELATVFAGPSADDTRIASPWSTPPKSPSCVRKCWEACREYAPASPGPVGGIAGRVVTMSEEPAVSRRCGTCENSKGFGCAVSDVAFHTTPARLASLKELNWEAAIGENVETVILGTKFAGQGAACLRHISSLGSTAMSILYVLEQLSTNTAWKAKSELILHFIGHPGDIFERTGYIYEAILHRLPNLKMLSLFFFSPTHFPGTLMAWETKVCGKLTLVQGTAVSTAPRSLIISVWVYKPPGMQTMYLQAKGNKKGSKKGWKKGAPSGGFTVALFLALFALVPLLYLVSFIATKQKKPGGKREKWEKGRKKGVKKGRKRATVNDPIIDLCTAAIKPFSHVEKRPGFLTTSPTKIPPTKENIMTFSRQVSPGWRTKALLSSRENKLFSPPDNFRMAGPAKFGRRLENDKIMIFSTLGKIFAGVVNEAELFMNPDLCIASKSLTFIQHLPDQWRRTIQLLISRGIPTVFMVRSKVPTKKLISAAKAGLRLRCKPKSRQLPEGVKFCEVASALPSETHWMNNVLTNLTETFCTMNGIIMNDADKDQLFTTDWVPDDNCRNHSTNSPRKKSGLGRKILEDLMAEKEGLAKAVASLNTVWRKWKANIHILELPEDDCDEE